MGIPRWGRRTSGPVEVDRASERPGPWQALREVALVLVLTFAYFLTRGLIRGRAGAAFAHAHQLLRIEQSLHVDPEAALQQLALAHPWLMDAANFFYLFGHLPVLISVAVWLFWSRPAAYRWFRNAFLLSAGMGLTIYALFPVAPPRYLPGFTDTLKVAGVNLDGSSVALFYNPYAAMPSLHVGWALLAAVVVVASARAWWLRVAGALLPALMTFTVLMTANHFLLDIFAGCAVAAVSLMLSAWWSRRRALGRVALVASSGSAAPAPTGIHADLAAVHVGPWPARRLGLRRRVVPTPAALPARRTVPPV